jgi:hypothetical protein
MCLIHAIGGAFTRRPEELAHKLSPKSSDLVKRAFDDIDPNRLIDHHVHVAGLGAPTHLVEIEGELVRGAQG